ncbi:MAG TPA: DUF885 family protein [bacterium]|nr:DUF885 family protein [bacterium]HMY35901.1 DUF885 family protein [bacterium]HMZ04402.1 DUF885 family protein [bacterium]HNB55417.1 DUF885 family protein [bacterium]HND78430.1 DUF885 family protein [bacterium]
MRTHRFVLKTILMALCASSYVFAQSKVKLQYNDLQNILTELRSLERIETPEGVPDHSASSVAHSLERLSALRLRYSKIDTSGWPVEQRIDHALFGAEINGLDFHLRVLRPWSRDPAYYALIWMEESDTPAHEGPLCHASIDVWRYTFPLSSTDEKKLTRQLQVIPPLLRQAQSNLTENARDLWIAGTAQVREQISFLDEIKSQSQTAGAELHTAISNATGAYRDFVSWLEKEAPSKNGPSGIGKENYTWYLRHVLMVPLSWEEEVTLLKRELDRAYASLALERQRNRDLPEIIPFADAASFQIGTDAAVKKLIRFLEEKKILHVKPYMEKELRKHTGRFQPESQRHFFANIVHRAPNVLYSHLTHWFETAWLRDEPHASAFRKTALPYNIWVSRSEGMATGMEELLMHAGLYDDEPRARELVWIMLAQRCARGLASLYAHANMIDYDAARQFQVTWTPQGWTGDPALVGFEQHLYLRMPGYGTSYVSGKYMLERLMMERSRQVGSSYSVYQYFTELYSAGMIPVSLIRWQLTGLDDEVRGLMMISNEKNQGK